MVRTVTGALLLNVLGVQIPPEDGDPPLQPPDASRPWTAEIRWRGHAGAPRFAVIVRDAESGEETVLAESAPLAWPPADAEAVQALAHTADALADAALRAGWRPLSRGSAWYARRFAWEPARPPDAAEPELRERDAAAEPGPAREPLEDHERAGQPSAEPPGPPSDHVPRDWPADEAAIPGIAAGPQRRRFWRRPWPQESEGLWRCEVRWNAGWVRSRFEALAQAPHAGRRAAVATSDGFSWTLHADPQPDDPEIRAAARALRRLLLDDGWTEIEPGRHWYAHRFLWHRDDEPPTHVHLPKRAGRVP